MDWCILISIRKLLPNSRGDNFNNTCNSYKSCVVQYLTYISINVPNINQFHSKTTELLSENKTLTNTYTCTCTYFLFKNPRKLLSMLGHWLFFLGSFCSFLNKSPAPGRTSLQIFFVQTVFHILPCLTLPGVWVGNKSICSFFVTGHILVALFVV